MQLRPLPFLLLLAFLPVLVRAQGVELTPDQYDRAKKAGTLRPGDRPAMVHAAADASKPTPIVPRALRGGGSPKGGGPEEGCECWIQPDATYTLAMAPNDDGSSPPINLPFTFNLYGDSYSVVYINNNGNLSFQSAWGTYTSSGFPSAQYRMVAPFWADVDTRPANGGQVWYKLTPTALYVNWVEVGYFNQQTDKKNTFQVIITNGNDPVIGIGNNVGFCYLDMQWTTGSASGGVGGFGGTPATVGCNRGNGVNFIQFGRFDHPGVDYDGPFGAPDGISWLDYKNFKFTTVSSTQNIPPIAAGEYICDTLRACVGQVSQLTVSFLSPEQGQTTIATSEAPSLSNWNEVVNTPGIVAVVTGEFIASPADIGFHLVTFEGTDNGVPNLTSTVNIVIEVIPAPAEPLVITGNAAICTGQSTTLTATPGYGSYTWSNGATGQSIQVSTPGTYTVTSNLGLCSFTSPPFTIGIVTPPALSITGPPVYCGEPLPTLTASPGFDAYTWSNGASGQSIQVTGGTYTVTGSYQGCELVSQPFTVTNVDPGPPIILGDNQYCEGGSVTLTTNASAFTTIQWSTGASSASITATAGTYTVTGTYLNCTYTSAPFTVTEIVLPEVVITGNANICTGTQTTLTATPGFDTYTWNTGVTGPSITVGAGTYFVTASIGPCTTSSLTFTVQVVPNPVPVITGATFSCGAPVTLSTTEPFSAYTWSNGATSATIAAGTGTYTVTVTNQFGCTGTSAPYAVLVDNNPTANFTPIPPSPQVPGTVVTFNDASSGNGGTIAGWWWDFGVGGGNSTAQNPSFAWTVPGTYPVTLVVTTANGCTDTLTLFYTIIPAEIVIPNVFSPNGDGVNDFFTIEYIEYFQNTLTIFNRWGGIVYEANNYKNTWRGNDVPDGTYYYVLRTAQDGKEYTGHITVLR